MRNTHFSSPSRSIPALAILPALLCLALPESFAATRDTRAEKPNIILILADDLGYADLGCQGSEDIRTPAIDRLAETGLRFTAAYITAPQCGPSRAGLMTGLNQARFGYYENHEQSGLPPRAIAPTMAEYLKGAGYTTGIVGKWHIGLEPEEPDKEPWPAAPWNRGFDYSLIHHGGSLFYFPFGRNYEQMLNVGRDPRMREVKEGSDEVNYRMFEKDAYLTDLFTDLAVSFIERNAEKPFFLYLSYTAPHTPLQAKAEDVAANDHIPEGPRRVFAGMMTALDRGVGRVREVLEDNGLAEDTLIVFLSDNGAPTSQNASLNDPFRGVKGRVLEGGIRVPFLVSWPARVPAGEVRAGPVGALDLLPTFTGVAGGKLSDHLAYPGRDLTAYWASEKCKPEPRPFVWKWRSMAAIRVGPWKLIDVQPGQWSLKGGSLNDNGLYNLVGDPRELRPRQREATKRADELRDILNIWERRHEQSLETETAVGARKRGSPQ